MSTKTKEHGESVDTTKPRGHLTSGEYAGDLTVSDRIVRPDNESREREAACLREEALSARRDASRAQERAVAAQKRSTISAERLLETEEVLAQSKARIFALEEAAETHERQVSELREKLERADLVMAGIKGSLSWRITSPLRTLKRSSKRRAS